MEVIKKINNDYITAVKARNVVEKNLLSIVRGDIQKLEKSGSNFSEGDVFKIIQRINKSLNEMLSVLEINSDAYDLAKSEIDILNRYLPNEMSESEIIAEIERVKSSNPNWNIGVIMAHFKDKPVDRKLVKNLID